MSELEQGAIIVGGHFSDTYGQSSLQFEVVGDAGQHIPTEIVAAGQLEGQLLLDYNTGIEEASVPVLRQRLGYIDERLELNNRIYKSTRNLVLGMSAVLGTFTTVMLVTPSSSGESTFDKGFPYSAFTVANALAYVGVAIGFTRFGRKQRDQESAPLLEEQSRYQANIAALGSLITATEA